MHLRENETKALHVAVGVVRNDEGEVLIARRHDHLHQGGLWEFPGGKVEEGESVQEALRRELHEELGIRVLQAEPLIQVRHAYADRQVFLDTWEVRKFSGAAMGREGQPMQWVPAERLSCFDFPAANRPIVTAARLPDLYGILNDPEPDGVLTRLHQMSAAGVRLVQLRAKFLATASFRSLATHVIDVCRSLGMTVLVNAEPGVAAELGADGVHLSAARLQALTARPLAEDVWVAASCHNLTELCKAEELGVDFAVLSPVLPTLSHPMATPLGWMMFRDWVAAVNLPVYALGGMNLDCLEQARQNGARGIAGIRGLTGLK